MYQRVKKTTDFFAAFLSIVSIESFADDVTATSRLEENKPSGIYDEILVTGGRDNIRTTAGSATYLGEEVIAAFDTTDVNGLLAKVPGVYIRQEDGFGLRPNIGLRGTNSDRSSKVTLMEDGILIGPAPYSAPAAYYIPNVNRMSAVEVFKGPSVVQYGPHTVGGAINFVTQPIPVDAEGELGVSLGSYGYQKANAFYGQGGDQLGFWFDLLSYGADGFKELDNGEDTGFKRNDLNTKWQWNSNAAAQIYQELQIKLGYADEQSDETYLGLTDSDFEENPDYRYRASNLDNFSSIHRQVHLLYSADFNNGWVLSAKAYKNTFDRSWNKFDGIIYSEFERYIDASYVLRGGYPSQLALLRDRDSDPLSDGDKIDVTDNDRQYLSRGIQLNLDYSFSLGAWQHSMTSGLRAHHDSVERDHLGRAYRVEQNELVLESNSEIQKVLNSGEVDAYAVFMEDKIEYGDYIFNLGLRHEDIRSYFVDLTQQNGYADGFQKAWLPSAGVFYQYSPSVGFLLGVNYGFSSKAATPDVGIDPEFSLNYEYGLRYQVDAFSLDLIGFYSDYSNLLGRCRASETCEGQEFAAGEALTQGLEFTFDGVFPVGSGWDVPIRGAYTYTDASFQESFDSEFSQWGVVAEGDTMPYIPAHQLSLEFGIRDERVAVLAAVKYLSEMQEASGSGVALEGLQTEELLTLDLSLTYQLSPSFSIQLLGQNVSDERRIVSRRPYGARPSAPRMVKAGVNFSF